MHFWFAVLRRLPCAHQGLIPGALTEILLPSAVVGDLEFYGSRGLIFGAQTEVSLFARFVLNCAGAQAVRIAIGYREFPTPNRPPSHRPP